jgi:2-keto-4-pentenoate hydratase/2-oxohepta-3-ene-1,7-dioic acid hydratase in catechol pathway
MNFVRIDREGTPVWGEVREDTVFTLTKAPFETISYDGGKLPLAACTLLAPCEPTKIVCVGKNYYDHALELGSDVPDHPILFLKGVNTLNHPNGKIVAPEFVTRLDYEGELAFVVKKRAKNIQVQDFAQYILGYTCLNDVTARDIQNLDGQWTRAKTMDGFAPIGPWVVDDIDPSSLHLETRLNGKTVQSGNTSQFMTKMPELFAFITAAMTLEAGDVVTTGTPAGIGPMKAGDTVEVEIEGIGVLQNIVG